MGTSVMWIINVCRLSSPSNTFNCSGHISVSVISSSSLPLLILSSFLLHSYPSSSLSLEMITFTVIINEVSLLP